MAMVSNLLRLDTVARVLVAGLVIVAAGVATVPVPAAAGTLSGLVGSWRGAGTATFDGGSREKLRCNGYYKGVDSNFSMVIRCASRSGAKIELRGRLKESGGRVSGSWEERTYNATGSVTGSASPGKLKLGIRGAINGSLSMSYSSASQSVSISTTGTTLRTVRISMRRR